MSKMRHRISVVICAYSEDRWGQLAAAVRSLGGQSVPPYEAVIVIDHNQCLLDRARSAFPGAVVVQNNEDPGLSGARNSGVAVASGDVIAFLDDDAIATPDWLEQLGAEYEDPRVMGVGGSITPSWHSERPRWFPEEFDWVVGCTYRGMPQDASPVRNLIGANMSFRRQILAEIGGFRSGMGRIGAFPAGCEETELCIRAQQRWPERILLYNPAAEVRHQVSPVRTKPSYFRSRCYAEGVSKALVSRSVGAGDGLSAERAYALAILPTGVMRGVAAAVRGDLAGLARATAIIAGLAITAAGYLVGLVSSRPSSVYPSGQASARSR